MDSTSSRQHPDTTLTPTTIKRVQQGVAAANHRSVTQTIAEVLQRLEAIAQGHPETRVHALIRRCVLRSLIHVLFRVRMENLHRIPEKPAILAANHLHHLDPLLLLGELPTHPHYYVLGDARTLYNKFWKRLTLGLVGGVIPLKRIWKEEIAVMEAAKAGREDLMELATAIEETVPTGGDIQTLRQIERIVLGILSQGDGLVLFPEGRLGSAEGHLHLPLKRGTVIYALRAGVPIVPVAIIGTHDLYLRKDLTVRFGEPLYFAQTSRINRQEVDTALEVLQNAMLNLLPTNYQEPPGPKVLRNFLNHMLL
ncbi:lysophospholipid acyltransferase family protein [Umezakia ovalisporum]|uniref:1-acyl-sn-glycerol-3-phosphate acyltransferase n=2 Tax=Umezakia ovalisporum TaxID=75695 RepID=A0AA43KH50_9CYAN|nr:1-acyl-sn-glycerol-3-phosphate acyltransferase [Umezakia ovalisporum]MBI1240556.1 1-acyl-sn-glycerol-3-phosphate acyltransferase [Nostoc sp. RI_552]MDH6055549.1 1-acyl-sn-glycerol-3-phosphate acyltransferase [Umezakia ovalisporum FSS-43]MDH6065233.1 1-acyl-sn-glycerol-3-phosphate acyltransferase [Umezakia ovalisporum FSS-62]MDH6067082.1 1-acyl-sn-glycerol-3-phosphate acyltransferase [Umezakia ovalisporum APH033B]MDH6070065.1 1-acyl-sn-glycerol-3-phosphate acyltransferase [Umezakia ovalispor